MKKLSLGLAILFAGFSKDAAALYPNRSPLNVCVPNYCGGLNFSLTGLYWRAAIPYLDYALIFPPNLGPTFNEGRYQSFDPNWTWGYKASVGYTFPCTGNDITLSYTDYDDHIHRYLSSTNQDFFPTFADPILPVAIGPITLDALILVPGATLISTTPALPAVIFPGAILTPAFSSISSKTEFTHNAVDLDFGQTVNVGCNFRLRWFGGLRYAHLENKLEEAFTAVSDVTIPFTVDVAVVLDVAEAATPGTLTTDVFVGVDANLSDVINQKSHFDGVGPQFGFEGKFNIGGGLGLVVNTSTSLIVGEAQSTLSSVLSTDTSITPAVVVTTTGAAAPFISGIVVSGSESLILGTGTTTTNFRHPDETRVVPNLDAKIGLNYTYNYDRCNMYRSFSVELGYWVSHYWNAVDRLAVAGLDSPSLRTRHTTDYSFEGPYIGVQVQL